MGLLFGLLNNMEEKQPKYYSCPRYCSVIHTHIGVESEEKKTNEQGPLPSDKWIAYIEDYKKVRSDYPKP